MRSRFNLSRIRKRRGHLSRALVILLLLYTGADLFMPQYFCGAEEVGGLKLNNNSFTSASKSDGPGLVSISKCDESSQPDKPAPETPNDEDCFCCCAHVIACTGYGFAVTTELRSFPTLQSFDFTPSPPLRSTYRPPRFA